MLEHISRTQLHELIGENGNNLKYHTAHSWKDKMSKFTCFLQLQEASGVQVQTVN